MRNRLSLEEMWLISSRGVKTHVIIDVEGSIVPLGSAEEPVRTIESPFVNWPISENGEKLLKILSESPYTVDHLYLPWESANSYFFDGLGEEYTEFQEIGLEGRKSLNERVVEMSRNRNLPMIYISSEAENENFRQAMGEHPAIMTIKTDPLYGVSEFHFEHVKRFLKHAKEGKLLRR